MKPTDLTPELRTLLGIARTLLPEVLHQLTDFAEFLGEKYGRLAVDELDGHWTPPDDEVDLGGPVGAIDADAVDLSGVIPSRILNGMGGHSAIGLI